METASWQGSEVGPTRSWSIPLPRALAALGAMLLVVALFPASQGKALPLLLLSSLAPLTVLRPLWNISTLAFAAPIVSLPLWSLATWLGFNAGCHRPLAFWPAALAFVLALVVRRRAHRLTLRLEDRDGWALGIALLACIPACIVFAANGGQPDGSYVARAWWGGDSFYFFSLVQMALARSAYPVESPFVAGAPNLYLAASHMGFAGLCEQAGAIAALAVPPLVLPLLFASFGILFLALAKHASARARGGRRHLVVPAIATLLWLAFRPDLFVYPHTQATVFGVFALVLLLHDDEGGRGTRALVGGLCVYLAFAHAVTSAVCTVYLAASAVHALARRRRASFAWQTGLVALLALLYVMLNRPLHPSLHGGFTWANLGDSAGYFRPWILPSLAVAVIAAFSLRQRLPWLLALGPLGLGVAYYGFGMTLADGEHRWFVAFNAERFPHYALLIALASLPLLSRTAKLVALSVAVLGLGLQPPALVHDSTQLVTAEPLRVPPPTLRVLDEVRIRTPPAARVLMMARMYVLPAFSGRAQAPVHPIEQWTMNALPAGEVAQRQREWETFSALAPADRERVVANRGYTHLVVQLPEGLAPEPFVQALLPSRRPQLLFTAGGVYLFALQAQLEETVEAVPAGGGRARQGPQTR